MGFPGGSNSKESPCSAGDLGPGFNPWAGKIPWRRGWQPTPVFFPGESHGYSSLVGYSPWGRKELDMTEATWLAYMHDTNLETCNVFTGLSSFHTGNENPTLCNPKGCSPSGSSVHGILQGRILEWVAMLSSRGFSQPRDPTRISYVSCIGRRVLYH